MPVVYRVKHDDNDKQERTATFFAKKGEASRFRREHKGESPDPLEKLTVRGRDDLCELLNSPYHFGTNGADDTTEEENEFL